MEHLGEKNSMNQVTVTTGKPRWVNGGGKQVKVAGAWSVGKRLQKDERKKGSWEQILRGQCIAGQRE